jgi:hypothetical protein
MRFGKVTKIYLNISVTSIHAILQTGQNNQITSSMQKAKFILYSLIILIGCSKSDDPSSGASGGNNSCRIEIYKRSTQYFQYKYNSDEKVSELTNFYNAISNPQYSYKFSYSLDKVDISEAYIAGGISPIYEPIKTIKLNKDGLPLEEILPDGRILIRYIYSNALLSYSVKKIYSPNNTLISNDSLVFSYDAAGKNIASIKYYSWKTGAWKFSYEQKYIYDTKVNPFYKMVGYEGENIFVPDIFSNNNYISDGDWTYSYTYNDKGYPDQCTFGTKGDTKSFQYSCK